MSTRTPSLGYEEGTEEADIKAARTVTRLGSQSSGTTLKEECSAQFLDFCM